MIRRVLISLFVMMALATHARADSLAWDLFAPRAEAQGFPTPTFQTVTMLGRLSLACWTTATRPGSPAAGWIGCNTTTNQLDYYNGSSWVNPGGSPGGSAGQVQFNNGGVFGGLTNTQLTALINPFSSVLSGSAPASGGGTTNFLRADGTWAPPVAAASSITVGTTTVGSTANGNFLFNDGGTLGGEPFPGALWANCVSQFGADPSGTSDSTTAIANCIASLGHATFVASGSSTNLTVASISAGRIRLGMHVSGTGVPANTYIVSQTTGTPGSTGVYVTNNATTSSSATITGASMGGVAYLPAGVYLASAIDMTADQDINILGDGLFATQLVPTNTTGNFITAQSPHGSIRNLGIMDSNATQSSGDMIYVNAGGVTVDTVSSFATGGHTFYNGIHMDATNGTYYNINNFGLGPCTNNCIQIGELGSTNQNVGGVITNGNIGSAKDGITVYSSGGMTVTNVDIILSTQHGVATFPGNGSNVFALYFTNVFVDTSSDDGWYFGTSGTGSLADIQMNNCWSSTNTGYGVNIFPAGADKLTGLTITGGDYINNGKSGVLINANARDVTINGANVFQNSTSGSAAYPGVAVAAGTSHFKIVNSQIGIGGATYESGGANLQSYGVLVNTGASDFYIVTNNEMGGNVTAGSFDGGSGSNKFFCDNLDGNGACGGGSGSPGGSNGQVQYNNSGAFGGLTNTQLTADINVFSSTLSGAAPASGGGTTNFLRADGTWTTPGGGGNVTTDGGSANNIANCNNSGCSHIVGTSYSLGATTFNPPDATSSLGDGTHRWTGLFLSSPLAASQGGTGATSLGAAGIVTNNISGAANNVMVCLTAPNCTAINPTSYALGATTFNAPDNTSSLGDSSHHWTDLFMSAYTWTPTILVNGVNVGSYSRQQGNYQTLGHIVIASFSIIVAGTTGSPTDLVTIGGFPVASISNAGGTCQIGYYANTSSVTGQILGEMNPTGTTASLFIGSAAAALQLKNSNITGSTQFDGQCTYFRS